MPQIVEVPAPDGLVVGLTYLVEYDEDTWLTMSEERREFCKAEWRKRAKPAKDVRHLALRLVPDELFPVHGRDRPYIAWQEPVDKPPPEGFTVTAVLDVQLIGNDTHIDPVRRALISRAMEDKAAPGTPWRILNKAGDVLEHGRL